MRKIAAQVIIVLFCLWHMFAVGVYAIPRASSDTLSISLRSVLLPVVTPYMLITSQWQLWDLFSPDPLRRVDYYRIEAYQRGAWFPVTTMSANDYNIWRHPFYSKLFVNVFNEFDKNTDGAKERLMQLLVCKPYHLPQGTQIRLVYEYYVVPGNDVDWNRWKPTFANDSGPVTSCPDPPDA
ncbi:MAG TPA: hypothetical protein VHA78_02435 [Candidatus Peribacteraceae bacterium]|nr:hypothetical protein [Candidatus Peribacteraceae bacterium]